MSDENKNNIDTRPQDLTASQDTSRNSRDPKAAESNVVAQKTVEANRPPALPAMSFDAVPAGTADMVSIARQVAVDIIKQVRVDGVSAQVSGGTIDFVTNSQRESPQSQWASQNWSNLDSSGGYNSVALSPPSPPPLMVDAGSSLALPAPTALVQEAAAPVPSPPPVSNPEPSAQLPPAPSGSVVAATNAEAPKVEVSSPPAAAPAPAVNPTTVGYSAAEAPTVNPPPATAPTVDATKEAPTKAEEPKADAAGADTKEPKTKSSGYTTDSSALIDGGHEVQYGSYQSEAQKKDSPKPVEEKTPEAPPEGQIIQFEMPDGTKIQARIITPTDQGAAQKEPKKEGSDKDKSVITQPPYDSRSRIDGGHEVQYGAYNQTDKKEGGSEEDQSPKGQPPQDKPPAAAPAPSASAPSASAPVPAPASAPAPPAPDAPTKSSGSSEDSESSGDAEPSEYSEYGGSASSDGASLNSVQSAEVTNAVYSTYKENVAISTQIPLYITNPKTKKTKVVFLVLQHHLDLDKATQPVGRLINANDPADSLEDDEYYVSGGGSSGTFLASYETDEYGSIIGTNVTSGSFHILNTNTDVPAQFGDGMYVYAVIEHRNAGIFKSFKIEITSSTKGPTNLDGSGKFVEFSNILLAEGMMVEGVRTMIQRRAGNFSLVHQLVDGRLCLWAYSSGGTSL